MSVLNGSKFYMRGAIYGDMNVGPGGRVHVLGNITGNVTVSPKTKVILGGTVGGDVTNLGGRLFVEGHRQNPGQSPNIRRWGDEGRARGEGDAGVRNELLVTSC